MLIDLKKPRCNADARILRQRFPEHIGSKQQAVGNGSHFDEHLVMVAAAPPVFRAGGVGPGGEARRIDALVKAVGAPTASRPKRRQAPKRSGPSLHGDDFVLVLGAPARKLHARRARTHVPLERIEVAKEAAFEIFPVLHEPTLRLVRFLEYLGNDL